MRNLEDTIITQILDTDEPHALGAAAVAAAKRLLEGEVVALPTETDVPNHTHIFLRVNTRLPQGAEFLWVLAVHRL